MKNYKYQKLMSFFSKQTKEIIKLSFEEIENIIGFKLPDSAYRYNAYWHPSETHTITKSWVANSYKMAYVSLGEYVEFERIESAIRENFVYKIEVYLSKELIPKVIEGATELGACKIGNYDHVASYYEIEGCWRPLGDSTPFSGEKNRVNYGREYKLELRCEGDYVSSVLRRVRELHPYEEALINVIRLENHLFE